MKKVILTALIMLICMTTPAFFYGDRIDITVYNKYGQTEFSETFSVNRDGKMELPLIGSIDVKNHNETTLKTELINRLHPDIILSPVISLKSLDNHYMVSGYVEKSGKYNFDRQIYLSDAIREAGGLKEGADIYNVRLIRGDREMTIDYSAFEYGENIQNPETPDRITQNIAIESGDRIMIEELDYLYVIGHVGNQFKIYYDRRIDVLDLILEAQPRERAALEHARILRKDQDKYTHIKVDLKRLMLAGRKTELPELNAGDILFVPKNRGSGLDMLWNTTGKISDIFESIDAVKTLRKVIF
ncbi:MAG: polysaccharide biosynthesis/export family protein [Candidatus Muiribacteriaceae bacterium]